MGYLTRSLYFLIAALFAVSAYGQDAGNQAADLRKQALDQARSERRSLLQGSDMTVLEGPIDPSRYILGPGDEFNVNILGSIQERAISLTVLPEGTVYIPLVGGISLNGLTLIEGQELIEKELSTIYKESNIEVFLSAVRNFRVYITGEIYLPGEYIANATTRMSSIIEQAENLTDWANGNVIEIRRRDGSSNTYDYWAYTFNADQGQNPTLLDGDVIFIPNRNISQGTVLLRTSESIIGYYPVTNSDNLGDFLERTGMRAVLFDWQTIQIVRRISSGNTETISLTGKKTGENEGGMDFIIKPGDSVIIPAQKQYVYVHGEVSRSGEYQWEPNRRASYYIGMAGKTDKAVQKNDFSILRSGEKQKISESDPQLLPGDVVSIPKKKFYVFKEYLEFIVPITSILISAKAIGVIK